MGSLLGWYKQAVQQIAHVASSFQGIEKTLFNIEGAFDRDIQFVPCSGFELVGTITIATNCDDVAIRLQLQQGITHT